MKQKQKTAAQIAAEFKRLDAALKTIKDLGYTVYAWKEGIEEIPEGLQHYANALADKYAQEKIEEYEEQRARKHRNTDGCSQNLSSSCGTRTSAILEAANIVVGAVGFFSPADQNKVLQVATGLIESERDQRIQQLRYNKARLDQEMKLFDSQLNELTNAQDQLNEK